MAASTNSLIANPFSSIIAPRDSSGPKGAVAGVGIAGLGGNEACGCDVPAVVASCRSNPVGKATLRGGGFMPVVFPLCAGDAVLNPSVPPLLALPRYAAPGHLASAIAAGSSAAVLATGVKAAGDLILTLTAAAGERQRFCAVLLEIGSNNNVTPGRTVLTLAGFDDFGLAITYTGIELRQSKMGSSQFLIMMMRNFSGLSIPVFGNIQKDLVIGATGENFALTAAATPNDATLINYSAGLQAADRTMVGTVTTGYLDTAYTLSTVVPATEYFDVLAMVVGEMAATR